MWAEEALNWGLVKEIVPLKKLLDRAIAYAVETTEKTPDSVIMSRLAAREASETGVSRATMRGQELLSEAMLRNKNAAEGLAAYMEKGDPKWPPRIYRIIRETNTICGMRCWKSFHWEDFM